MTKKKLNEIADKGRQALAELDQNEEFNWDIGDKVHLRISRLTTYQDENLQT
jgi:hypothetical protein